MQYLRRKPDLQHNSFFFNQHKTSDLIPSHKHHKTTPTSHFKQFQLQSPEWLLQLPAVERAARVASAQLKPNALAVRRLHCTAPVPKPSPRTKSKDPAAHAVLVLQESVLVSVLLLRTQPRAVHFAPVVLAQLMHAPARRPLTADFYQPRPTSLAKHKFHKHSTNIDRLHA